MKKILVLGLALVASQGFGAQAPKNQGEAQSRGNEKLLVEFENSLYDYLANYVPEGRLRREIKSKHSPEVDLENIKKLLAMGVSPNAQVSFSDIVFSKLSPLRLIAVAAKSEDQFNNVKPLVNLLISSGANVVNHMDNGMTALMMAAQEENLPMVNFLLKHGADITLTRNGENVLHFASIGLNLPILTRLLDELRTIGREDLIDQQNNYGWTPLMQAANSMYDTASFPIIELLMNAGANPTFKNGN